MDGLIYKNNQLPCFFKRKVTRPLPTRSSFPNQTNPTMSAQSLPHTTRRRASVASAGNKPSPTSQQQQLDYARPRRRSSRHKSQPVVVVFHTVPRQRRRRRSRSGSRSRSQSRSSSRSRSQPRRRPSYVKVPGMSKALRIGRPSPMTSATLFSEGTVRRGQDGNYWEVRVNRAGVQQWRRV